MTNKSDKRGRASALDRAQRIVARAFPGVKRYGNTVMVGEEAIVAQTPGQRKLVVQCWTGATPDFCNRLMGVLRSGRVSCDVGEPYELGNASRRVEPRTVVQDAEFKPVPKKKATRKKAVEPAEERLPFHRLSRSAHVRRCLQCKELLDHCGGDPGDEYDQNAVEAIQAHVKAVPEPENVSCHYAGCVHHEDMPKELAITMIGLGEGDKPWRDRAGVLVSNIALEVKDDDAPAGWDFKRQDVMQRSFKHLAPHAGIVYCRLGVKRTTVHVWATPTYPSRRANMEDVPTIEDVLTTFRDRMPAVVAWCRKKFQDLKGLAEMDLDFESDKASQEEEA